MNSERQELLDLIKQRAVQYGEFTLSSGRVSGYYIDLRKVTMDPKGAYLVAKLLCEYAKSLGANAIGGPELGACPIAGAVAAVSTMLETPIKGFFVRKSPKSHGTKSYIEGPISPDDKLLVVDDTLTSGNSILQAIKVLTDQKYPILGTAVVVDRMEGGKQILLNHGFSVYSLFTKEELEV